MNKKCKWRFDIGGNSINGANDPITEKFKSNYYYSIVRESIQNSLDAVDDLSKPVEVKFEFCAIQKKQIPELFDLEDTLNLILQTHKGDYQAQRHFKKMLAFLQNKNVIEVLKISDFNTFGMDYEIENDNCPFISFVRGEGKSIKSEGAGGSFGFGKGAYFVLSELRAIVVSTKTINNKSFFEGKCRLASFKKGNERFSNLGYFNLDFNIPVTNEDSIPDFFRRKKAGTDFYILGLRENEKRYEEMIKSVLNNFWLTIYKNKLIVQIKEDNEEIIINSRNLEIIIEKYFKSDEEIGSVNDLINWNPKPYFKAFKYSNDQDRKEFYKFEKYLENLGDVSLHIYKHKDLLNRISYFRKPCMTVMKKTKNLISGYAAVFLCESNEGNELLRQLENPAHNQWHIDNLRDANKDEFKKSKAAYSEMNKFITDSLNSISVNFNSTKIDLLNAGKYLSAPDGIFNDEYDEDFERESSDNELSGNKFSEKETSMQTTIKTKSRTFNEIKLKPEKVLHEIGYDSNNIEYNKVKKNVIELDYIVYTEILNDKLYHIIRIQSDKIRKVDLKIFTGSDNLNLNDISIEETNNGQNNNNLINNVTLYQGITDLRIKFKDNLKHSIYLFIYENK